MYGSALLALAAGFTGRDANPTLMAMVALLLAPVVVALLVLKQRLGSRPWNRRRLGRRPLPACDRIEGEVARIDLDHRLSRWLVAGDDFFGVPETPESRSQVQSLPPGAW